MRLRLRLKSIRVVIYVSIGLCILLAFIIIDCLSKPSPLQFAVPTAIDLGHLEPNTECEFNLPLTNTSGYNIRILEVVGSCHCVKFKPHTSNEIAPKAQILVSGTMETKKRAGSYQEKILIKVKSADGNLSETKFVSVRCKVESIFELSKGSIDFGTISYDSPAQYSELHASSRNAFGIEWDSLRAESSNNELEVSSQRTSSGNYNIQLKFVSEHLPIGAYHGVVRLVLFGSRHSLFREYEIPVNAMIAGPLAAQPSSFYLGHLEQNIKTEITIISETFDMRALRVKDCPLSITPEILHADARSVRIEATIDREKLHDSKMEAFNEAIVFEVPYSNASIRVPFVGFLDKRN